MCTVAAICAVTAAPPLGAQGVTFQTTADVGVAVVDEDVFISTRVDQQIAVGGFTGVLSAPMRLRVADRPPDDDGVLREQDWDSPSDFARIVPRLSFERVFSEGFVDLYAGSLNAVSIGGGELVSRYFNSLDMDRYQGGVLLRGAFRGNGAELMLDNVVSPSIVAGRLFAAPLAWFLRTPWAQRVEVGYTFGVDFRAPIRAVESGTRTISVMGGELAWRAVDRERITLRTNVLLAAMDGDLGVQAGAKLRWVFNRNRGFGIALSGAYRFSGSDYNPSIYNPFYDFNRYHFPAAGAPPNSTLADYLSLGEPARSAHGAVADIAFEWEERLEIGARYERTGGHRPHWVTFFLSVSPLEGYHLRGFYAGQDLNGGTELFSANALFGLEGRGRVWGPIDLFVFFSRIWRDIPNRTESADDIGGGIGVAFSY